MSDTPEDADTKRVTEALGSLIEHFDSVHIFATRHESGEENGTINLSIGRGNWFSRYGQIRTWIEREEEKSRIDIRKATENEP
jgi:hypothetical protein